ARPLARTAELRLTGTDTPHLQAGRPVGRPRVVSLRRTDACVGELRQLSSAVAMVAAMVPTCSSVMINGGDTWMPPMPTARVARPSVLSFAGSGAASVAGCERSA